MRDSLMHASCIDFRGKGVIIAGRSGSGKSALALQMIALGASLVADDRVHLTVENEAIVACAPATIKGLVEARGVGILQARPVARSTLALAVDMDKCEQNRLPKMHFFTFQGLSIPCLYKVDAPYFAAAILLMLKSGRQSPA